MAETKTLEDLGKALADKQTAGVAPTDQAEAAGNVAGEDAGAVAPPSDAPVYERKVDEHGRAYATGKRKDAVARVWLQPGSGRIIVKGTVNRTAKHQQARREHAKMEKERDYTTYFARPVLQMMVRQPLVAVDRDTQFDIHVSVAGGGLSGQAGAVRHGIAKALTYFEPELRPTLKHGGFLTRDSRVVERKKYGRAKARRSFQFSKR